MFFKEDTMNVYCGLCHVVCAPFDAKVTKAGDKAWHNSCLQKEKEKHREPQQEQVRQQVVVWNGAQPLTYHPV